MRASSLSASVPMALLSITLTGCGGAADDGPLRHALSGQVTYNGQPVPVGEVAFEPDSSRGNTGPQTIALIKDGRYETPPGKGTVGGDLIVWISGFDGKPYNDGPMRFERGKQLFPSYETKFTLDNDVTTKDFDVP